MSAFTHPTWLWCLLFIPALTVLFFRAETLRRSALNALLALRLQPRLAGSASTAKRRAAFTLTLLGLALLVLAMARPSWGFEWRESKSKGRDIVIALDTSRSMLADDLKPNRLTRAKLAAQDLLTQLSGDRVGLIAFAGSAFLQAPLTPDYDAVRDSLNELDTDVIPRGGTDISAAIQTADEAFGKGESDQRALIIFTDGEDLADESLSAARDHKDKFRIFTVGLGSAEGSLIPTRTRSGGTDFVRDEQGQPVKSRLDEKRLREVAEAGGGFYIHLQNGPAEMRQLTQEGLGTMREKDNENKMSKQPIERFQWPLLGGIVCIATAVLLGERRRAFAKAAALVLLASAPLQAADPGAARFAKQDFKGALEHYETKLQKQDVPELHYNAGSAAYQLGEYDKAATAFSQALGAGDRALQSRAEYNLANTLAKRGTAQKEKEPKTQEWKNALQHYEEALKLDPQNKDAEHNRNLVTTAIAELEKQEQKEEEQKKQEQKKQDEKKDEKKGDQSQEQKDKSEKGEKKEGEQKDSDGKPRDDEEKPGEQKDPQQAKDGDKKDGDEKKEAEAQANAAEPEKQKAGDLKSAGGGTPSAEKQQQQAEAAEAAAAAREGRMTDKDAKTLLDAQKKYDVILPPIKMLQEQQKRPPVPRNW